VAMVRHLTTEVLSDSRLVLRFGVYHQVVQTYRLPPMNWL